MTNRCVESCFNSTMVRLKVSSNDSENQAFEMFQFHNGSIKSLRLSTPVDCLAFQFHNGSIKSRKIHDLMIVTHKIGFNSTMVRLKGLSFNAKL